MPVMGDQHYAIVRTDFEATPTELVQFRDELERVFRNVWPLRPEWTSMFLVYDKDFDNCSVEIFMDDAVAKLSGILSGDAEIVWSWDHISISKGFETSERPRQRAWYIEGKKRG